MLFVLHMSIFYIIVASQKIFISELLLSLQSWSNPTFV